MPAFPCVYYSKKGWPVPLICDILLYYRTLLYYKTNEWSRPEEITYRLFWLIRYNGSQATYHGSDWPIFHHPLAKTTLPNLRGRKPLKKFTIFVVLRSPSDIYFLHIALYRNGAVYILTWCRCGRDVRGSVSMVLLWHLLPSPGSPLGPLESMTL